MQNYQDTDETRLEVFDWCDNLIPHAFHMPSDITKKMNYFPSLL